MVLKRSHSKYPPLLLACLPQVSGDTARAIMALHPSLVACVPHLQPSRLVLLLHALAKIEAGSVQLLQAAATHLLEGAALSQLPAKDIALLAWSYARMGLQHRALFTAISEVGRVF